MYPLGGILSPGQIVVFDFSGYFTDNGVYKANIEIFMNHYAETLIVPVLFRIDGIPIVFDPPLKDNLILGPLYYKKTAMTVPVTVKNRGLKPYILKFTKINPNKFECEVSHT